MSKVAAGIGARSRHKRKGFTASPAQREKVRDELSIVSKRPNCDPAHLTSRAQGGCDSELCVVPLTREEHRAFDQGQLDILPHLLAGRYVAEIQHAVGHANGSLIQVLHRLTGTRWSPE